MAKLKYHLEPEAFEALEEHVKGLYDKQEDGAFRLSVEGATSKSKVDSFRTKNVELLKERDALTQLLAKHVPQEKLDELANELAQQRTQELGAKLSKVMIDKQISTLALARGARAEAIEDITQRASKYFKVNDNGDLVPIADPGATGALTADQFIDALKNSHGFYFGSSNGGGAAGGARDESGRFKGESKIRFKSDLKTPMEKSNYIRDHGFAAFEALPLQCKKNAYQDYQRKHAKE
jgi:hypothetical protein